MLAGLLLETGEARDVHHMCTLLGYGADAICPYLAMEAIVALQEDGKLDGRASRLDLINNYIKVSTPPTISANALPLTSLTRTVTILYPDHVTCRAGCVCNVTDTRLNLAQNQANLAGVCCIGSLSQHFHHCQESTQLQHLSSIANHAWFSVFACYHCLRKRSISHTYNLPCLTACRNLYNPSNSQASSLALLSAGPECWRPQGHVQAGDQHYCQLQGGADL